MDTIHRLAARVGVAGVLVAFTVLAGCGYDQSDEASSPARPAATRSYVGTAQGTGAFVGVVVDGSRALAYVCDGVPSDPVGTVPTVQAWFSGRSDGETLDVTQPEGRLQLRLGAADLTGTLTLSDGRRVEVSGRAVTGDAGLYRAEAAGNGRKAVAGGSSPPTVSNAAGSQATERASPGSRARGRSTSPNRRSPCRAWRPRGSPRSASPRSPFRDGNRLGSRVPGCLEQP